MSALAEPEPADRPEGFVQSLERGLAVIQAFGDDRSRQTLADIARATGMSRAAARRYLLTLQHLGFVGADGQFFFLRSSILRLGYAYLASQSFADVVQPRLEDLSATLHESCSASVLDNGEVVYVARASSVRIMSISLTLGARLPAYCTSMGRVLLAHLPPAELDAYLSSVTLAARSPLTVTDPDALRQILGEVREQGWCLIDQELESGVRSIAAPIRDATGVIAAINASAHVARVSLETMHEVFVPAVTAAATEVSRDLAGLRL